MTNFEKIRTIVIASSLAQEDKNAFIDIFAEIEDQNLDNVAKLLEKDVAWVEKINDNRKKKKEAFATGNKDLWNQVLEEEKQYMEDMTYDLD
jgi:hypothetical protein